MNKMKKILAVLCIAIAVVMCLPNLKFLSRAGFGDYFDSVKGDFAYFIDHGTMAYGYLVPLLCLR